MILLTRTQKDTTTFSPICF